MAKIPFPQDGNGVPYLGNKDSGGNVTIPTEQYILSGGLYVPISATNPLPTSDTGHIGTSLALQTSAVATGNGASMNVAQYASVGFDVEGTFVGTVTFEVSNDQTNWYAVNTSQSGTSTISTTAAVPGIYYANVGTVTYARARISAYTSGSINVTAYADPSVRPEKSVNASITGSLPNRPVTVLNVASALAITDTANHDISLDLSNLSGRKLLYVINTANQTLSVSLVIKNSSTSGGYPTTVQTVNAGTSLLINSSAWTQLLDPLTRIVVRFSYSVAPTSGSISAEIEAVSA